MNFEIATFYKFIELEEIDSIRKNIRELMKENEIVGTIIIAHEGFNATVCGRPMKLANFISSAEGIFDTKIEYKSTFHSERVFQRIKVKKKQEIVTLRKEIDLKKGEGTHIEPKEWNALISDPDVYVLDTRNEYEFRVGSFRNAVNPEIANFVDLPEFIEQALDRNEHKKIAMFCTGGIRCEKFAPYMKEKGFEEVYQLKGGILKYLEEIDDTDSLWEGECFVFDERITVDQNLNQGSMPDFSTENQNRKNK